MNRQKHFEKEKGKQKNQNTLFSLGKKNLRKERKCRSKIFFFADFRFYVIGSILCILICVLKSGRTWKENRNSPCDWIGLKPCYASTSTIRIEGWWPHSLWTYSSANRDPSLSATVGIEGNRSLLILTSILDIRFLLTEMRGASSATWFTWIHPLMDEWFAIHDKGGTTTASPGLRAWRLHETDTVVMKIRASQFWIAEKAGARFAVSLFDWSCRVVFLLWLFVWFFLFVCLFFYPR